MARRITATAAALTLLATSASAQFQFQTPNDAELRSAYCIPVLNAWIGDMQNGLAEMDAKAKSQPAEAQAALQQQYAEGREMIAKLDSARERLKSYLVPRMMQLDPIATSLAMKRGEADWRDVNAMMQRCPAKCTPLPKQQVEACLNECNDKDLWNRVRACMNPNWLPF